MPSSVSLPIHQIQADIIGVLTTGPRLVLVAPTGSGKTTQVPQMLLDAGLAGDKRIIVLQPRRVAARTVAARVAWERHSKLGAEVGYQIRFEDQTSLGTRICFVTEGILLRWLQDDRLLSDIGIILFDEFHERNLLSDVALALVKELQEKKRNDLKIVVMSATLDAQPVANYLGGCPVLISEGQMFPVEVNFLASQEDRPIPEQAAEAVEEILAARETGDILVFMPGMAEINATVAAIRVRRLPERLALIPLHGELPAAEQDLAFAPNPLRKVIVSTNVAETSVTIDGVRHVVDGGLARVSRYDAERGIGTLLLEPISRASADQRKGRAGRTAPGTCRRLWTESGHLNRPARNTPEIQRSDLAEVVLLLHSFGVKRAAEFAWLDRPDPTAVERAEKLLRMLGALREYTTTDAGTDLTPVGRQMLRLPMHPRYSRMLVEAARQGCVRDAALCAALVSGRDLLLRLRREEPHVAEARERFETSDRSDFFVLINAYGFAQENHFNVDQCRRYGIHAQTALQVAQTWEQLLEIAERQRLLPSKTPPQPEATPPSPDALLRCLMVGFIDQLCVRRDQGTLDCQLTEGRTGTLMRESVVQKAPLFVAATIRKVATKGSGTVTLLGLASSVELAWITELFPQHLQSFLEYTFDRTHKRVTALKRLRFADLIIAQEHQHVLEPAESGRCLADAHTEGHFELPLFKHELKQFIARTNLVAVSMPELELKTFTSERIRDCLAKAFHGLALAKEAQATPLSNTFIHSLPSGQSNWVKEMAPGTLRWPDGRELKLTYPEPEAGTTQGPPELQIKLHECFQLREHPAVCEGRVPVKLWLCGPDGKRLQSTSDWLAFRRAEYPKLKSGLQKKYPGVGWL